MAKPISPFLDQFKKTEVSRPCNYEVEILPSRNFLNILSKQPAFTGKYEQLFLGDFSSPALDEYMTQKGEENTSMLGEELQKKIDSYGSSVMKFKCESAAMPGRTFSLIAQRTYGPEQRHPLVNFYPDIKLVFICSDDMFEKIFFDSWFECMSISSIKSIEKGQISLNNQNSKVSTGLGVRFDMAYKDDYMSNIKIKQLSVTGSEDPDKVYEMLLVDAFPYAIDTMPLSWRASDSYHRISVSFTYRYYETNKPLSEFFKSTR